MPQRGSLVKQGIGAAARGEEAAHTWACAVQLALGRNGRGLRLADRLPHDGCDGLLRGAGLAYGPRPLCREARGAELEQAALAAVLCEKGGPLCAGRTLGGLCSSAWRRRACARAQGQRASVRRAGGHALVAAEDRPSMAFT